MLKTFRKGGIHPAENKSASLDISVQALPMVATVPLSQHIGVPAVPLVGKGARVTRGQLIASAPKPISANIHAPVTGTVVAIDNVVMPNGAPAKAIVIKASDEDHTADTEARARYWAQLSAPSPLPELDAAAIRAAITGAGIVGLGGATFPTAVKLDVKPEAKAEVLIINACECEPYLTCDAALMQAYPSHVIAGIEFMLRATGIPRAIIGIENNKHTQAGLLRSAAAGKPYIDVVELKTKYPQGGEKQLVEALTGRRIASGRLPLSVGAVVHNVATAFAVWQAVATDMPLIERIITVSGDIPADQCRNYLVAFGTPISELPFSLPADARVILGGPMMGRAAVNLDAPITKGASGVLLLAGRNRRPVQPCIRCGACVDACPMGLEPYLLSTYGRMRMWNEARAADVTDCLECGACSYSCPSARPLLDYIRIAKQRSRQ